MKAKTLSGAALVAAIVLIVAWLGAMIWLAFYHVDDQETKWSRLILLFNSLQAVGFGAVGALLGTKVQLPRVEAAEQRAAKAEGVATKGKELAATVKAEAAKGQAFNVATSRSLELADELLLLR